MPGAGPATSPATVDRHGATKAKFSVSGWHRARYEWLDPQYRPTSDTRDQVLALDTSVSFSAEWPHLNLAAELLDARGELNDSGSTLSTSVVDAAEPVQAYVGWTFSPSASGVKNTVRAGRVTLDLGKRRLIARNRYRNTVSSFLGVDWRRQGPRGQDLHVFFFHPMNILPSDRDSLLENEARLDKPATGTDLWGAFYAFPALRTRDRLELYAIKLEADEQTDHRDLATFGVRLFRPASPEHWHYEIEAMRQTGTSTGTVAGVSRTGLDHRAYLGHVELGYTFMARGKPDLMFQYDTSSGDRDPNDDRNERFDTLFGARRFDYGPTGIYGPFPRANLETSGVRLGFVPAPRWQSMVAYRAYRLQSARDAWTTTGLRDASGQSGDSLGRQAEAQFSWNAVEDRLGVEAGYAYFSKGRFVERTAPAQSSPSNYFYAALTVSF
ncbi:MAG TPA: alginate export family protein [Gammaproteobacteria bacterium]|nr:alginate export family protein [Gammaproteobacteria bacterium]